MGQRPSWYGLWQDMRQKVIKQVDITKIGRVVTLTARYHKLKIKLKN